MASPPVEKARRGSGAGHRIAVLFAEICRKAGCVFALRQKGWKRQGIVRQAQAEEYMAQEVPAGEEAPDWREALLETHPEPLGRYGH